MKIKCPTCRSAIPANRLNVNSDVAVCDQCDEAFSISRLLSVGCTTDGFDINDAPAGAWFEDFGDGWRLGATTRSAAAFFLVPSMCVWSGFALGGIYGSQIVKGQFNLVMSLFGIPFVLGTLFLGSMAVMSVCGKVIVSVDRDGEGQVFTGVGMIGWTRRFHWASMTAVEEAPVDRNRFPFNGFSISIIGQSRLKFGTMLSEPVRFYLIQSLRYLLLQRL